MFWLVYVWKVSVYPRSVCIHSASAYPSKGKTKNLINWSLASYAVYSQRWSCLLMGEKTTPHRDTCAHIKVYPRQQRLDTFDKTIWPHTLQIHKNLSLYSPLSVFACAHMHVCVCNHLNNTTETLMKAICRCDSLTANMECQICQERARKTDKRKGGGEIEKHQTKIY